VAQGAVPAENGRFSPLYTRKTFCLIALANVNMWQATQVAASLRRGWYEGVPMLTFRNATTEGSEICTEIARREEQRRWLRVLDRHLAEG